eukprot:15363623-Ditylum_brightwellii.AAC.1
MGCMEGFTVGCSDGINVGRNDGIFDGSMEAFSVGCIEEGGNVNTAGCTNGDSVGSINGDNVKNGASVCCNDGISTASTVSGVGVFFFKKRSEVVKMRVISPTMITTPTINSKRLNWRLYAHCFWYYNVIGIDSIRSRKIIQWNLSIRNLKRHGAGHCVVAKSDWGLFHVIAGVRAFTSFIFPVRRG